MWTNVIKRTLQLVVIIANAKMCHSSGRLSLQLLEYHNKDYQLRNGDCCDNVGWCIEPCDNYFDICVTEISQSKCNLGKIRTKVLGQDSLTFPANGGDLGNGQSNPLLFNFQEWKGFTLTIEIWDYDTFINGNDDFVDTIELDIRDKPDPDSKSARINRKRMKSSSSPSKRYLDLNVKTYCHTHFLVPDCSRTCIARDDDQGHYTCDYVNGRVLCNKNWYGDRCTKYCQPRNDSLGHYTCDRFGEKNCSINWFGVNCSTFCKDTGDEVGHYQCDKITGRKVCLHNWFGEDCLVFCVAKNDMTGHYSCNLSSGEKLCGKNWYGVNCRKYCEPQDDMLLGHFTCDVTGRKTCLPGWRGPNCTLAITALLTCRSRLELWVDGVWYGKDNGKWRKASSFEISPNASVIAIKGVELGNQGGIIGSLSNGLVTDESWRCTIRFHNNWMGAGFDDKAWPHAVTFGSNGVSPWGRIPGIADNANWIWTADNKNDQVVYCRQTLRQLLSILEIRSQQTSYSTYYTTHVSILGYVQPASSDPIKLTSVKEEIAQTSTILSIASSASRKVNSLQTSSTQSVPSSQQISKIFNGFKIKTVKTKNFITISSAETRNSLTIRATKTYNPSFPLKLMATKTNRITTATTRNQTTKVMRGLTIRGRYIQSTQERNESSKPHIGSFYTNVELRSVATSGSSLPLRHLTAGIQPIQSTVSSDNLKKTAIKIAPTVSISLSQPSMQFQTISDRNNLKRLSSEVADINSSVVFTRSRLTGSSDIFSAIFFERTKISWESQITVSNFSRIVSMLKTKPREEYETFSPTCIMSSSKSMPTGAEYKQLTVRIFVHLETKDQGRRYSKERLEALLGEHFRMEKITPDQNSQRQLRARMSERITIGDQYLLYDRASFSPTYDWNKNFRTIKVIIFSVLDDFLENALPPFFQHNIQNLIKRELNASQVVARNATHLLSEKCNHWTKKAQSSKTLHVVLTVVLSSCLLMAVALGVCLRKIKKRVKRNRNVSPECYSLDTKEEDSGVQACKSIHGSQCH